MNAPVSFQSFCSGRCLVRVVVGRFMRKYIFCRMHAYAAGTVLLPDPGHAPAGLKITCFPQFEEFCCSPPPLPAASPSRVGVAACAVVFSVVGPPCRIFLS